LNRLRLVVGLASVLLTVGLASREAEIIDTAHLGERGVIFESHRAGYNTLKIAGGIGDFDADGHDDIAVVGAAADPERSNNLTIIYGRRDLAGRHRIEDTERIAVFRAGPQTLLTEVRHLRALGDLDGDGFDDFFFGPLWSFRVPDQAYKSIGCIVYGVAGLGGRGFFEDIAAGVRGTILYSSDPLQVAAGFVAENVGDFNGDGHADLAVSAPSTNPDGRGTGGAVFVIWGTEIRSVTLDLAKVGKSVPGTVFLGRTQEREAGPGRTLWVGGLGTGLVATGDVNGDGLGDLLLTEDELRPHRAYLILGSQVYPAIVDLKDLQGDTLASLGIIEFFGLDGNVSSLSFRLIGSLGDVNRDGLSDFILGAERFDFSHFPEAVRGRVFTVYGRREFPASIDLDDPPPGMGPVFFPPASFPPDGYGNVASPGDLDGDGVPDLLIGASNLEVDGLESAGQAFAVYWRDHFEGEVQLGEPYDGLRILGESAQGLLGSIVAPAGDFNGDGNVDVLVGSIGTDLSPVPPLPGRVYLIYGRGNGWPPLRVLEVEPDFGPIRGGTEVHLIGSGLEGEAQVFFGGVPALRLRPLTGNELIAVSPPRAETGAVDVTVRVGAAEVVLAGAFHYVRNIPAVDLEDAARRGATLLGDGSRPIGESLALGDLDGDGAAELAATYLGVAGESPPWSVLIVVGGRRLEGTLTVPGPLAGVHRIDTREPDRNAGVRFAGDVDGDGFGDLGIGVVGMAGVARGLGYVLFGRPSLPERLVIDDEVESGGAVRFEWPGAQGTMVFLPAGDIGGDGIPDLGVVFSGAPDALGAGAGGQLVVVEGRRDWPALVDLSAAGRARVRGDAGRSLGFRAASVGDVNGDGQMDFLAGTNRTDEAFLILGGPLLPPDTSAVDLVDAGGAMRIRFTQVRGPTNALEIPNVAAAGDVDGDGFDDMLLGVEGAGVDFQGITYLYRGRESLPEVLEVPRGAELVAFVGQASLAQAGRVGPAGDFDGDGLDDFLIGAPGPLGSGGNVFVVFGRVDYPGTLDLRELRGGGIRIPGTLSTGGCEISVRETGDFDGDGASDLVFAERGIGPGEELGKVHVVYGFRRSEPFLRGDSNFDGRVDIADPIFTLGYLFLGGLSPLCADAADADDSGRIEITDAVGTLEFLFRGGRPLPSPSGPAGEDPTADGLDCAGF
jgi:hypothetical protein